MTAIEYVEFGGTMAAIHMRYALLNCVAFEIATPFTVRIVLAPLLVATVTISTKIGLPNPVVLYVVPAARDAVTSDHA